MKPDSLIQRGLLAALLAVLQSLPAHGQETVSENMNGTSSSYPWKVIGPACLTAGNGTGTIPACAPGQVGGTNGKTPDPVGSGALRLTPSVNAQTGAVIGQNTFPSGKGVQISFKSVTYGHSTGNGADGMAFFLMDGTKPAPSVLGSTGGGLGYACSSLYGFDGLINAYLGIGIDEFGNFGLPGLVTGTGPGFKANSIVVRGGGSVAWSALTQQYPTALAGQDQTTAMKQICNTGVIPNTNIKVPAYNYRNYAQLATISTATFNRGSATPITYTISITPEALLSVQYSVNGGATQMLIDRDSITAWNGPLPSQLRFGFSGATGGLSNVHEILCFKATPFLQSSSGAGANVQQGQQIQTGSQLFSPGYASIGWSGSLRAQSVLYDSASGLASISSTVNWEAACALTGGACQATGGSNSVPGSSNRKLLTWDGSTGIAFQWTSLTAAQQAALTSGDATPTSDRFSYLRGDRTNELTSTGAGKFRARTSLLGDIMNSGPVMVGAPSLPYADAWKDLLDSKATQPEGSTYAKFQSDNATRQNVVYVGANDGFLHGFRAGVTDANGNFVNNDGAELIGYMPSLALNTIHSGTTTLDFSGAQYGHNYYVDAVPGTGDLYYGGAWHTWLVGGLGAGGNATGPVTSTSGTAAGALYALDITNPATFSEANAGSLVIGEWTSATITCVSTPTNCGTNLGSVSGTPIIRRLHNGQWAVIFGNGLNSSSGKAGVFVMTIDQDTGDKTIRFLDTGSGATTAGAKNGIVNVAAADLDGDHVADYLYAGDVLGNLWRFDLTSKDPANWAASSSALFSTSGLPITTSPIVIPAAVKGGTPRVLVEFGTGQALPLTQTSGITYASGTQAVYGIWDWNMSAWNALKSTQYASLTAPQTIADSNLQVQTFSAVAATSTSPAARTLSRNPVCWQGSNACSASNNKFGWKLALSTSEQLVYSPKLQLGTFAFNTTIPPATSALDCTAAVATGYTMALDPTTGGATAQSFFPNSGATGFSGDVPGINGIARGATGSPYLVTAGPQKTPYFVQQTTTGQPIAQLVNRFANAVGNRLTWINLR